MSTTKAAKKTTKTAKKATKKAASKRIRKKEVFERIPEENFFVLADGRRVDHYVTLAHLLEEMEEDIVRHHVNELRHDFANWIQGVFSEEDLAKKIAVVHDPEKMRLIIYRHIIDKHLK
ncbi:hypothetical protein JXA48_04380 [Candidatus Woesearchaeota archaeon]|nr:hypothetical protein [Candidatus Woesearchaeota archaeon]